MNLFFKKVQRGYIVYNTDTNQHTHIKSPMTCIKLIGMLEHGVLPSSPYLVTSARRLLSKDEFMCLKPYKKKQKYINIQKGASRV